MAQEENKHRLQKQGLPFSKIINRHQNDNNGGPPTINEVLENSLEDNELPPQRQPNLLVGLFNNFVGSARKRELSVNNNNNHQEETYMTIVDLPMSERSSRSQDKSNKTAAAKRQSPQESNEANDIQGGKKQNKRDRVRVTGADSHLHSPFDSVSKTHENPLLFQKGRTLKRFFENDEIKDDDEILLKKEEVQVQEKVIKQQHEHQYQILEEVKEAQVLTSNHNSDTLISSKNHHAPNNQPDVNALYAVEKEPLELMVTPREQINHKASTHLVSEVGGSRMHIQGLRNESNSFMQSQDIDALNAASSYAPPFQETPRYMVPQQLAKHETSSLNNDAIFWQQSGEISYNFNQITAKANNLVLFEKKPENFEKDKNFFKTLRYTQKGEQEARTQQNDSKAFHQSNKDQMGPPLIENNQFFNDHPNELSKPSQVKVQLRNNQFMAKNSVLLGLRSDDLNEGLETIVSQSSSRINHTIEKEFGINNYNQGQHDHKNQNDKATRHGGVVSGNGKNSANDIKRESLNRFDLQPHHQPSLNKDGQSLHREESTIMNQMDSMTPQITRHIFKMDSELSQSVTNANKNNNNNPRLNRLLDALHNDNSLSSSSSAAPHFNKNIPVERDSFSSDDIDEHEKAAAEFESSQHLLLVKKPLRNQNGRRSDNKINQKLLRKPENFTKIQKYQDSRINQDSFQNPIAKFDQGGLLPQSSNNYQKKTTDKGGSQPIKSQFKINRNELLINNPQVISFEVKNEDFEDATPSQPLNQLLNSNQNGKQNAIGFLKVATIESASIIDGGRKQPSSQGSKNVTFHQNENHSQGSFGLPPMSNVVATKKRTRPQYEEQYQFFGYDNYSLCIFGPRNNLRKLITKVVTSNQFEYGMIFIIVLNSVTLALYDYQDRDALTLYNQVLDKLNLAFTVIFLIEALLRIIAHGFLLSPDSYMRNGWNLIDATVVVAGLVEMSFKTMNLKSLRVVRIFRPLKSINTIQSMKQLIQALIRSIPQFANVVMFLVFMFLLFATIGLHQYNGSFYNACRTSPYPESPTSWPADVSEGRVCSTSGLGSYQCPAGQYCRNPSDNRTYSYSYEVMDDRGYVNYGITNFDNLGRAMLTVFQIVTSDTWYQQMCNLMDMDIPILGGLYCLILMVLGQFFLMNLILAVIIFAFIKSQKESLQQEVKAYQEEEMLKEKKKKIEGDFKHQIVNILHDITDHNSAPHQQNKSEDKLQVLDDQRIRSSDYVSPNQPHISIEDKKFTGRFVKAIKNVKNINRVGNRKDTILNKRRSSKNFLKRANSDDQIIEQLPSHKSNGTADNEDKHISTFLKQKAQKRKVANLFMQSKKSNTTNNPQADNFTSQNMSSNNMLLNKKKSLVKQQQNQQQDQKEAFQSELKEETKQSLAYIFKMGKEKKERERLDKLQHDDLQSVSNSNLQNHQSITGERKTESNPNFVNIGTENDAAVSKKLTFGLNNLSIDEMADKGSNEAEPPSQGLSLMQRLLRRRDMKQVAFGDDQNGETQKGSKNNEMQEMQDSNADQGGGLFRKIFKQYIEKKIEQEYENYFRTILKEATENVSDQANMREIVGIKVGLEYIRQQQVEKERLIEERKDILQRKKDNRIYSFCYEVSNSDVFQYIMVASIIINTLILSLDKYPVDINQAIVLEKLNYAFTAIFTVELIIKLLGVGIKTFFKGQWFNIFDSLIVLGSLVDIVIAEFLVESSSDQPSSGSVITALRGFRLLRIFKLARTWKRFELLLETMQNTLKDVASFSILLFLFIFIFTLLGMELFAYKAKLDPDTNYVDLLNGESPTFNFDTFLNSFSLVFIFLTNDGTSAIYYNYYRSVSALSSTIYFTALVLIGQKIMLNLFVAILLENFDEGVLRQKMHDYEQKQRGVLQEEHWFKVKARKMWKKISLKIGKCETIRERICCCFFNRVSNPAIISSATVDESKKQPILLKLGLMQKEKDQTAAQAAKRSLQSISDITSQNGVPNFEQEQEINPLQGRSLFVFQENAWIREVFLKFISWKWYDWFIILVILVNSIQLALDYPLIDPKSKYAKVLYYIDYVSTVIFIAEACIKIMIYGFYFNGPLSYLKSTWNRLDFLIVIFSIMAITPLSNDFKAFKVFRILRLISRNAGLQVAVQSLLLGLPNILNVTVIMLLFFLIFGVISVSQFKGKFYFCEGSQVTKEQGVKKEVEHKWDCINAGGEWINQIYNFDDIPNAMITLFVMSTTAGWQDVLMNTITSTDIDYAVQAYRSPFWSFFYILFLIVGFFFFLNLFIGVVVTNFNTEKDKIGGNDLLTEKQREWIDLKLLVLRSAPIKKIMPPENPFRLFFFKIQKSTSFNNFIFVSIVLNTLVLMLKWYQQAEIISTVLEYINYVFTAIFAIEVIIKLIGQGLRPFFRDAWNTFDFLVALASGLSIIISARTSLEIKGAITLLRSFKILRILRLLKRGGRNLHMIFNTFVITISSLVNIGALLLLIIYMYSVLGMVLFGMNMRTGLMNHYINFENFINAFLTLFTVTTGDSWNATQTSFVVYESPLTQCMWNPTYEDYFSAGQKTVGCGGKILAYIFFTSYYFIVSLIFLQLFIAVILQGYDQTQIQEARLFNNEMNRAFRENWADFDPEATTFISLYQLRQFLMAIGAPLGFDETYQGKKFLQDKFIASLDLPTYYDFSKYQFLDVLDALSFRLMVLDHIKQTAAAKSLEEHAEQAIPEESEEINDFGLEAGGGGLKRMTTMLESKMKDQISKEINKLMYQKTNENITAVQDVIAKEMTQQKNKEQGKDKAGLTSSHHMAAEAAVRQFKSTLHKIRAERMRLQDGAEIKAKANEARGIKTANIIFKKREDDQVSNFSSLKKFDWNLNLMNNNDFDEDDEESKKYGGADGGNNLRHSSFRSSFLQPTMQFQQSMGRHNNGALNLSTFSKKNKNEEDGNVTNNASFPNAQNLQRPRKFMISEESQEGSNAFSMPDKDNETQRNQQQSPYIRKDNNNENKNKNSDIDDHQGKTRNQKNNNNLSSFSDDAQYDEDRNFDSPIDTRQIKPEINCEEV